MRYDAFEIHSFVLRADEYGTSQDIDDDSDAPNGYSLHGHLPTGGIECIATFDDGQQAVHFKNYLEETAEEVVQLRRALAKALTALNAAPRIQQHGVDTYAIAAEISRLLRSAPSRIQPLPVYAYGAAFKDPPD